MKGHPGGCRCRRMLSTFCREVVTPGQNSGQRSDTLARVSGKAPAPAPAPSPLETARLPVRRPSCPHEHQPRQHSNGSLGCREGDGVLLGGRMHLRYRPPAPPSSWRPSCPPELRRASKECRPAGGRHRGARLPSPWQVGGCAAKQAQRGCQTVHPSPAPGSRHGPESRLCCCCGFCRRRRRRFKHTHLHPPVGW